MSDIKKARERINQADAIMITAGAGMGVDSGLPDFRGIEGFWRAYPRIKDLGLSFEEIANPKWFLQDPPLAWAFYGHRLNLYRHTIPHSGFTKLRTLVEKKETYFIFTSNVDGQFQKAGFDPNRIVEVHGSIHHLQCSKNCTPKIYNAPDEAIMIDEKTFRAKEPLPSCPACGAIARPNIMMFTDYNFNPKRTDIQSNRLQHFIDRITQEKKKLVILEFGAGEAIPTVRLFGEHLSRIADATLIRVNPREYHAPANALSLPMKAKEAIALLCD